MLMLMLFTDNVCLKNMFVEFDIVYNENYKHPENLHFGFRKLLNAP